MGGEGCLESHPLELLVTQTQAPRVMTTVVITGTPQLRLVVADAREVEALLDKPRCGGGDSNFIEHLSGSTIRHRRPFSGMARHASKVRDPSAHRGLEQTRCGMPGRRAPAQRSAPGHTLTGENGHGEDSRRQAVTTSPIVQYGMCEPSTRSALARVDDDHGPLGQFERQCRGIL